MTWQNLIFLLLTAALLPACKPSSAPAPRKAAAPPPDTTLQLEPGIQCTATTLNRAGTPMKLWFYTPSPNTTPSPCILIAPAGSRLFHGMELGDGDREEHLPWVRKGFAVVAFEIDGPLADNPTNRQARESIDAFRAANAGIDDAKAAFDYAAARPEVDPARIYIVGHSSAATLALQAAEHDPRLAGCVAFAPACNLPDRLSKAVAVLDNLRPGTFAFLTEVSPDRHAADLTCPTMLFTARDDTNVPSSSVLAFATQLQATNKHVKVMTVASGGHYDSMMRQGIPAAIDFLQSLPRAGGAKP